MRILLLSFSVIFMASFVLADSGVETKNEYSKTFNRVETLHSINFGSDKINYKVIYDRIKIFSGKYNNSDNHIADVEYIAYIKSDGDTKEDRPITFLYNGGPGGASAAINFLGVGPKIISLGLTTEFNIGKRKELTVNKETWLKYSDLVFIDMPETGYSRLTDEKYENDVFSRDGDAECCAKFIYQYLIDNNRIKDDLYIAGESYGGIRTIAATDCLEETFMIMPKGMILISPAITPDIEVTVTNKIIYALSLPSMTATAYYYKQLDKSIQQKSLQDLLKEVQNWSMTEYLQFLVLGDSADSSLRETIARKLKLYTGISEEVLKKYDYKIPAHDFCNDYFEKNNISLNYLDTRSSAYQANDSQGFPNFFLSKYNWLASQNIISYLRNELKIRTDLYYILINKEVNIKWIHSESDCLSKLGSLMKNYPNMKVFIGSGYYDLDIPYYLTQYKINQLYLPEKIKSNIELHDYKAGHMIYLTDESRENLYKDIGVFYKEERINE